MTVLSITPLAPYDFELSLQVTRSFAPEPHDSPTRFSIAVRMGQRPVVLQMHQTQRRPPVVAVHTSQRTSAPAVRQIAEWLLCAELDLQPFYRIAHPHPVMGPIVAQLHGLKPMRPGSLFEMVVIAVTEQQISMTAAYHIRRRLVEHYGERVDGQWAFPTAGQLCGTTIAELMGCGLSQRKAEYVLRLAQRVADGELELDRLPTLPDEEVRVRLLQERGLGPWSAEYILIRGLSRPDRVPADDLGIRTIVGRYLGTGGRVTAQGVMRKLAPFKPYRGLAAFYLLAYWRLSKLPEGG